MPALAASAAAAGYTAFLFGQAEGRDLWQSRWLLPHLLVQATKVGAGALAVAGLVAGMDGDGLALVAAALAVACGLDLAITALDLGGHHHSRGAAVAARTIVRGRYRTLFWAGSVAPTAAALLVAVAAWDVDAPWLLALAGVVVQPALLVHETVYVRAGQDVPLS